MAKQDKTRVIYVMKYAMEMIALGHNIITTIKNPKNPKYDMWLFENDETFDSDFDKVRGKE